MLGEKRNLVKKPWVHIEVLWILIISWGYRIRVSSSGFYITLKPYTRPTCGSKAYRKLEGQHLTAAGSLDNPSPELQNPQA